jgi:2-oxoglutarate ferredoxin oxidoreductase subunit alpha
MALEKKPQRKTGKNINDFCITFSTINGSGSATANTIILRSLFRMGIPVSGKNIFPSNIQGLPTWYSIRLSKDGFLARLEKDDVVIAMNPATIEKEIGFIVPHGVLFYADDIKLPDTRHDIVTYPMPIKKLAAEADAPNNLKDYIANMVYVGIVAQVLGIDLDDVYRALDSHFKGKKKAIDSNFAVIRSAADWAGGNLKKQDRYFVERMDACTGCIMADGNTAGALGALYGGLQFAAWYPITPASSMPEAINEYVPQLRKDPETGKLTTVVVQSEDELAAIGMAVGAGWAGLRSMTSTSGPGLSLMSEYLGLAYYTEVPVVVWDVQRVGPSTGLPTRSAQGDITFSYFISHGDTQMIMLFPGSVEECFEFGWKALDIAEQVQTPVMVMIDLDLGMNQWMTKRFKYPEAPIQRGKILWEEDLKKLIAEKGEYGRYLDVDGDGIPYRTVVGNQDVHAGYFTRGTGHDEYANYSEEPRVWERILDRIAKKIRNSIRLLPRAAESRMKGASIGLIGYGSTDPAIGEARHHLAEAGIPSDYLRLRSLPFGPEVKKFINDHPHTYVIEMNRDGQMYQLLTIHAPEIAGSLRSICHIDGLPLTARWIVEKISKMEKE